MSERVKEFTDISKYKIWVRVVAATIVIQLCQSGSLEYLSLYSLNFQYISIVIQLL